MTLSIEPITRRISRFPRFPPWPSPASRWWPPRGRSPCRAASGRWTRSCSRGPSRSSIPCAIGRIPPGYPVVVGLGKLLDLVFHDPFTSLVALSSPLLPDRLLGAGRRLPPDRRRLRRRRRAGGGRRRRSSSISRRRCSSRDRCRCPTRRLCCSSPWPWPPPRSCGRRERPGPPWGWGRRRLGRDRLPASARPGRPAHARRGALADAGVAPAPARRWRPSRSSRCSGSSPLVAAVAGLPAFLDLPGEAGLLRGDRTTPRLAGRRLDREGGLDRFSPIPGGPTGWRFPVLALALAGTAVPGRAERRAAALPLAVLCGAQLAVCLRVMDPADGVRYALPVVLGVAFAAAVGSEAPARLARRPAAARLAPVLAPLWWRRSALVYAGPCSRSAPPPSRRRRAAPSGRERHLPPPVGDPAGRAGHGAARRPT